MDIKEIAERNYYATKRRGQISRRTDEMDFVIKIQEETRELLESIGKSIVNPFDIKELADIVLVSFSMARHFGYDLLSVMEQKMLYNEKREL